MAGSIAKKGLQRYMSQLQRHPLRTKAITAGVLSAISDIVSQKLSGIQKLQIRRLLLKVLLGFAYLGPFGHFFHLLLDKFFKGKKDPKTVAKKVIVEQLTASPLNNLLFMIYYGCIVEESKMLQLLFTVLFAEGMVVMSLLFYTPLRNLILSGLDQVKRGHGPIVIKTVCATIFVVLTSTIYSAVEIQRRGKSDEVADLSPTDQVLFAKHLLDVSLMGFILFLALLIDRLHHYIRELSLRRKTMELEAGKRSEAKSASEEEAKARELQVETFKEMIRHLEAELQSKIKEANASEANVAALRKQSEGLLSEYDQLLTENQELRDQLRAIDQTYSRSPTKKDS